jgi:cell division septum initiation protein DivIVA
MIDEANPVSGPQSDLVGLIQRLEETVLDAQRIPFGNKILMVESDLLEIIDQMRINIPEEIRDARRIMREREAIPRDAQREAEQILTHAREQANRMISDEAIVREAEARSEQMIEDAQNAVAQARREMDAYSMNMLRDVEHRLNTHLSSIHRAINLLDESSQDPGLHRD